VPDGPFAPERSLLPVIVEGIEVDATMKLVEIELGVVVASKYRETNLVDKTPVLPIRKNL
jgi:hypothetical protein